MTILKLPRKWYSLPDRRLKASKLLIGVTPSSCQRAPPSMPISHASTLYARTGAELILCDLPHVRLMWFRPLSTQIGSDDIGSGGSENQAFILLVSVLCLFVDVENRYSVNSP